jgi:hypothetical protein
VSEPCAWCRWRRRATRNHAITRLAPARRRCWPGPGRRALVVGSGDERRGPHGLKRRGDRTEPLSLIIQRKNSGSWFKSAQFRQPERWPPETRLLSTMSARCHGDADLRGKCTALGTWNLSRRQHDARAFSRNAFGPSVLHSSASSRNSALLAGSSLSIYKKLMFRLPIYKN